MGIETNESVGVKIDEDRTTQLQINSSWLCGNFFWWFKLGVHNHELVSSVKALHLTKFGLDLKSP